VKPKEKCNLCGKSIEGRSKSIVVSAKGGIFHFNCNRKFVRIVNEYEILIASLKKNGYKFTRYEGIMHSIRRGQLKFRN
jgi:hypothetical protein